MQGANDSISSRYAQYDGQNTAPPSQQEEGRNIESSNVFAAQTLDRGAAAGPVADTGSHFAKYYPDDDDIRFAEYYPDVDDMRFAEYYPDVDNMSFAPLQVMNQ